jgi:diacylglycerol kinase family enzyme
LGALVESTVVGLSVIRLGRRRRWRAAGTLLASSVGARLAVPDTGSTIGVGAAYGLGRVVPAWRVPLLGLSAIPQRGRRFPAWMTALGGAMTAVAVADYIADRRGRPVNRRRTVAVVVNVNSGSPHLARRAVRSLRRQPLDLTKIIRTTGPGLSNALREASDSLPRGGVLAVAGGDGTVGRAASYAANSGHSLAILPTGTGNDVARSLGVPLNPEEAVDLVVNAKAGPIDLAVTASGSFAHAATVGMTADFARRVRDIRGWRRPLLYPLHAWHAWRDRRPLEVEVVVDGRPLATPAAPYQIAIVNAPRLGGRIGVTLPGSAVDDGLLDAVISHRHAARHTVETLTTFLRASKVRCWPGAVTAVGRVVEIRGRTLYTASLDGEPVAATPLYTRVEAGCCRVIRPLSRTRPR